MLLMLVTGTTQSVAQNVTIGPNNGSIITGQAGGNVDDSGIGRGMGSMWRHQQLPLTMTTSDIAMLTSAGELADPSCAIDKYTAAGYEERLLLGAGRTQTFIVVSLPKGYRITGYKLVVQPNVYGNGIRLHPGKNTWDIGTDDHMRIYETEPWSVIAPYTTGDNGNSSNTHCDITDLAAHGYSYITVAHEVGNNGNLDMYNDTEENRSKEFVIEREAIHNETDDTWDMSNQLHFFFGSHGDGGGDTPYQYAVTIKSFEIWFTAEGAFNADLTPISAGPAVSAVQSPFTTSKMDIGALQYSTTTNLYYYDYTKVQDLIAYNWIYQDDAYNADGIPADVATNKNIYPLVVDGNGVFAFGNDTYFVEPPTTIRTSSGWESPIGYRVVGADFKCNWGSATEAGNIQVASGYRIRSGSGNRYLNDHLDFADVNQNNAFIWHEDEYHNLYFETTVGTGSSARTYRKYLACFGEGNTRMLSLSSSASGTEATWNLKIDNNSNLYYESDSHNMYYLHVESRQEGSTTHYRGYVTLNQTSGLATASSTGGSVNIPVPAFTPGSYTLKIYDKTGTSVVKTIDVTESNAGTDATKYTLEGLNNDAVKFEITGLQPTTDGKATQALVNVTLHLEALNPYIDKMDIVCHDDAGNLELSQPFTASDFSVSGGKFIFYVPDDYSDVPLTFTFSDLYSKYGDNTYYSDVEHMKMNGNARYSYVTSDYFKKVSGNQVSGVDGFPVNGGLYDTSKYDPDEGYKTKVYTSTAGNVRFKFNNAEDLASATGSLIEYPFSATTYLSGYGDPDWKASSGTTQETGAFIPCKLIANPAASPTGTQYQKSDIFYVFTADETRYNIAPTTGLQHRSYAFYRMDIELEARTFKPKFTYTKIYDKTFQLHEIKDADGNVTDTEEIEDSMWGLTLDIEESGVDGYLTYQEIIDHIQGRGNPEDDDYIAPTLDSNNTLAPKYMRQILYVDGTPLSAMLNSSENSIIKRLQDLKDSLAVNNIVFLPVNTTSTLDNTAYKTLSGTFRAGKDIVLTDKQPFYSPYDIQVDAANRATYTRLLTQPDFGQAVNATVMLPFTLALENGLHTNDGGTCSFTVNTMETGAQMATVGSSSVNYGTAYFKLLTEESTTEANKPYMIKVENIDGSVSENNTISFIATQKGSSIVKSPDPQTGFVTLPVFSGKLIQGETAQAKYDKVDYYFTNYASYSGGKFDRAVSEDVFYFSKNKYVDLHTLYPGTLQYLMSYPFRGVYTYSTSAPADPTTGAKPMKGFYISYDLDDMESAGFATRLEQLGTKADMMIRSGKGFITITATADQKFIIRTLNGMAVKNVGVNAGNTTTVNLPAGIYLVNNTKITVK